MVGHGTETERGVISREFSHVLQLFSSLDFCVSSYGHSLGGDISLRHVRLPAPCTVTAGLAQVARNGLISDADIDIFSINPLCEIYSLHKSRVMEYLF